MDEITHTIMPSGGNWGGTALGAGVGGLVGSWLGNGGFGGFGAGRGADSGYYQRAETGNCRRGLISTALLFVTEPPEIGGFFGG